MGDPLLFQCAAGPFLGGLPRGWEAMRTLVAQLRAAPALVAMAVVMAAGVPNPEEFVDTLGGTDSRYDLSHGNLLPLVARPWSFNTWAPQTDNDPTWASWWFHPTDVRFFGLRCTHQPSPWIGDYGNFRLMPSITDPSHSDPWQFSAYDPTKATFKPYLFNATLVAYGNRNGFTTVEVSSTNHGAVMRVRFPPLATGPTSAGFNQTRRILLALNNHLEKVSITTNGSAPTFSGYADANNGGTPLNFAHYFVITVTGGDNGTLPVPILNAQVVTNQNDFNYAFMDFDPTVAATQTLTIRIATSLISVAQAALTLQTEIGAKSLDDVLAESKAEWRATLLRANILDVGSSYSPQEQSDFLTVFYSSLYRATLFPRFLMETAPNGSFIHYSPYDALGGTFPGVIVSDSGFWDAYRTVYPQLSILYPSTLGQMIQGWINAYKEGGWLPKWASPGYRGSMVGTMGDVSLADAIVKKIPGFNVNDAYAAIRQDAFVVPPPTGVGRQCLEAYLQYGYIPQGAGSTTGGCYEVVARTLNYILSDFATAQAATVLGQTADAAVLTARAANYSKLFEPTTGFFRSRDLTGQFTQGFDEFAWGGDYTEAGPWQYRFYVPHDPMGLAQLYKTQAGLDMCSMLEQAQTLPSIFHIGAYGSEIHEMTEMALLCWGQYEHDNQPVHHMLYMYIASDPDGPTGACAQRGQYWLRQAMTRLYNPGPAMFCGDEDNGEVASWYILSALGLYALAPGTPNYVLGSPLFSHVQITLDNTSRTLDIVATNNSATNVYVQSVTWNGQPVQGVSVNYADLMQGGVLNFTMTDTPNSSRQW